MRALVAAVLVSALSGAAANRPTTTLVSYDIELEYTGFMSLSPCTVPLNPNGYDRMVGTVTGNETSATGVDIEYTGPLSRTTDIDICNLTGPTADRKVDCKTTLTGSAMMNVSLVVTGDADRGAWLKAKVMSTGLVNVSGNCDEGPDDRAAYLGTATGGAGGASPDGQQIEDRFSQPSRLVPSAAGSGPRFFSRQSGPFAGRLLPTRPSCRRLGPLGETAGPLNDGYFETVFPNSGAPGHLPVADQQPPPKRRF